jgi:hypothetical protein
MGIFNFGKTRKKEQTVEPPSFSEFKCYYLYGFVNRDPSFSLRDQKIAGKIYRNIIGEQGGVFIGNSLHPYCIVNIEGRTIWQYAYIHILYNKLEDFDRIRNDRQLLLMDLSPKFRESIPWDPQLLLTTEESPFFSTKVPFVLPFLVWDKHRNTVFDRRITEELVNQQHAHDYLEEINGMLKEFMQGAVVVIGFDEFIGGSEQKMITNFIEAKTLFEEAQE